MLLKRGSRKAQVTLFVIMGLILLIALYGILQYVKSRAGIEEEFKTEPVPEEFKPVVGFVENCIHQVTIDAIKRLGAHGGYIDPLDATLTPRTFEYEPDEPTKSELVSLSRTSSDLVPYYLFVPEESNAFNYGYSSAMPSVEEMEYQIARYVEQNVPFCVQKFSAFSQEGFSVEYSKELKAKAKISRDTTNIYLTYPLNITKSSSTLSVNNYAALVRFPFLKYYELAQSMVLAEYATQFSESFTLSLINYYSGADFNRLPPIIEHSYDPFIVTWSMNKVKFDFDGLLISYVPALQVVGTKGYKPITADGTDIENAFYKSLSMEIYNSSMPKTSMTFIYPQGSMNLRVQPNSGNTLRPSTSVRAGNQFIPSSKDYTYKFFYDVSYPLVIEIRGDETGYELDKYSFLFALESNLVENKPVVAWQLGYGTQDWNPSYLNVTMNTNLESFDSNDNPISFVVRPHTQSLLCRRETWVSGNITIRVVDDDNQPLEGADIFYGCGDYDSCIVGETKLNGNNEAIWSGPVPLCVGGYFSVSKEGYSSRSMLYSSSQGQAATMPTQKLFKVRKVKTSVMKKQIQKNIYRDDDNWTWMDGPASLGGGQPLDSSNEQVLLTLTQVGASVGDEPVRATVGFGKDVQSAAELDLVPGEYEIEATLIDHAGITIPVNCARACSDTNIFGSCSEYDYYPDEPVAMNPAMWGGLEFKETTTGTFKLTANDLAPGRDIEFYVLKLPDLSSARPADGCVDNLQELEMIANYSEQFKSELEPVIR